MIGSGGLAHFPARDTRRSDFTHLLASFPRSFSRGIDTTPIAAYADRRTVQPNPRRTAEEVVG
jgi:hypothetical protein